MQTEPQSFPSPQGPRLPIEPTEHCPTCDSAIPAAKFEEVRARLGEERLRAAEAEAHMRHEFEAQVTAATAERDQATAKMKELEARETAVRQQATAVAEARVRQETEAKVAAAATERDHALTKVKELEAREVTVREQATTAAEARVRQETAVKVTVAATERDQALTKVKELEAREVTIREQATAAAEARVRQETEAKVTVAATERDQALTKVKELEAREVTIREQATAAAEARVRQETEAKVTLAATERDHALTKVKELEAREVTIREQAAAAAEARVRQETEAKATVAATERDQALTKVKELEAREVTIREQATAVAETRVRQETEAKVATATAERDQATGKAKEMEAQYQRDLAQLRGALEKDRDTRLIELTAQNHRDREKLQELVNDLTRKLQQKTANDLGDGAEADVFDALRDAFPTDHITRIGKGQVGADISHKVFHKGTEAGTILVESKNCQRFQSPWVTKLREDQIAGQADYAILATTAFPPDRKELYIDPETNVIVVSPARAVEVTWLVRQLMIRMHCLGLSLEQRIEKRDQLYRYLTSEQYRRETAETSRLTSDLADIDVDEKREHDKVWAKRGRVTSRLRHLLSSMDSEVSAILEQAAAADEQQDPSA